MTEIPSTPADGNELVLLLPGITDTSTITVAQLTGAGVVDITCYLTGNGYSPTLEQQVIDDERYCSKETYEKPGRTRRGLDVEYIDNTNTPHETDFNKAKETLLPGSNHVVAVRRGPDYETAPTAQQEFRFTPITAGEYNELPGEANSIFKIQQKLFITGRTIRKKVTA